MSFILDALNRSEENCRQQLSQVPTKKVLSFPGRKGSRGRSWRLFMLVPLLCVAVWTLWPDRPIPEAAVAEAADTEVLSRIVVARPGLAGEQEPAAVVPLDAAPVPRQIVIPPERASAPAMDISDLGRVRPESELERIFPGLNVSMHYYNPVAERSLMRINGQLLHEHDSVAGQLVVTQITSTGAIVNYRGRLYALRRPGYKAGG
jgi:hypothetical protein